MDYIEIIKLIGVILTGIATAIPLVIKLVEYVKKAQEEKNWAALLQLVMELMQTAEGIFTDGADKKAYVLKRIEELSIFINYEIDLEQIGALIDELCDMSKVVNAPGSEGGTA